MGNLFILCKLWGMRIHFLGSEQIHFTPVLINYIHSAAALCLLPGHDAVLDQLEGPATALARGARMQPLHLWQRWPATDATTTCGAPVLVYGC